MINILTLKGDLNVFFDDISKFFINIWNSIEGFFLQYMSQQIFNVFIMAIIIIIITFIFIAIINRN